MLCTFVMIMDVGPPLISNQTGSLEQKQVQQKSRMVYCGSTLDEGQPGHPGHLGPLIG